MRCIIAYIAKEKGRNGGFAWGFFLSIIWIIIVAVFPNENDKKIEIVSSVTEKADTIKNIMSC